MIISVLILVSKHIKIYDIKKLIFILSEMNRKNYSVIIEKSIVKKYQLKKHHQDIVCCTEKDYILFSKSARCCLVIGLRFNDKLTSLVANIICQWSTIFIVPPKFGTYTDGVKLINEGAYCLCTIYDFNRYLC